MSSSPKALEHDPWEAELRQLLPLIETEARGAASQFGLSAAGREEVRGHLLDWLVGGGLGSIRRRNAPASVRAFVRRLARRLAQAVSGTAAEQRLETAVDLDRLPIENSPPPRDVGASHPALADLAAALTPRQRAVVRLHAVEGHSIAQTAKILNITKNAVRHAFRRALRRLSDTRTAGEANRGLK